MTSHSLKAIQDRFDSRILKDALQRFGYDPDSLQELEGSAVVYEGLVNGLPCILKIAPGFLNPTEKIIGSSLDQVLAEVDFVNYLAANGMPVAHPIPSIQGNWVEILPLDEEACFLAYTVDKVPGIMFPDEDVVEFPEPILLEWGRLSGQLHRLSAVYTPTNPDLRRLSWLADDLLDFPALIPPEQTGVYQRRAELLQRLKALPQDTDSYGLIHGDFHHGNFLADGDKITLFDFDAANYFWFAGEVCTALYNCLPLPRSDTAARRDYALTYLRLFLRGYRQEKPFPSFWLEQIPLFLKFNELLHYAYLHKYWDLTNLSNRRSQVLSDLRRRLEEEIPVVAFKGDDLNL